jgi:hypothetical protein
MTSVRSTEDDRDAVVLWLDPVCPFSWNTARWLHDAAGKAGFDIELRLMSLAVLNEGRDLPPAQQARMQDSRRVGRLMAAVNRDGGPDALYDAYFAFGQQYFDHSAAVDKDLVAHVTRVATADTITAAVLEDSALDAVIRESHEASQRAHGDVAGSPLLSIGERTMFGPVFSAPPDPDQTLRVFDAVTALIATPQFHQLERPRNHA